MKRGFTGNLYLNIWHFFAKSKAPQPPLSSAVPVLGEINYFFGQFLCYKSFLRVVHLYPSLRTLSLI